MTDAAKVSLGQPMIGLILLALVVFAKTGNDDYTLLDASNGVMS